METNLEKITGILTEKGATNWCHRCDGNQFSVLTEHSDIILQKTGRSPIPVALVICENCGAITLHALSALGLSTKEDDKVNEQIDKKGA